MTVVLRASCRLAKVQAGVSREAIQFRTSCEFDYSSQVHLCWLLHLLVPRPHYQRLRNPCGVYSMGPMGRIRPSLS